MELKHYKRLSAKYSVDIVADGVKYKFKSYINIFKNGEIYCRYIK